MNPFEMVIGIVLIVTIGRVLGARYGGGRSGRRGLPPVVPVDSAETRALQAEIRTLKDRIQVLERIATDTNRAVGLEAEIEQLRDRANP